MQKTENTVPDSLSENLITFCRKISASDPVFVNSIIIEGAKAGYCFRNVEQKIQRSGGAIAYGWAIWNLPSLYFEAEHHAVWRNKQGKFIDVSPQIGRRKRMLFLPDESAVYDPWKPRQNIMHPDGETSAAIEIAELGNLRHSIFMRCRELGTDRITLYDAYRNQITKIDNRFNEIKAHC